MTRVQVAPSMLRWARNRAGRSLGSLEGRFPRIAAWEAGDAQPTFRQLQRFAQTVHVPFGTLFLEAPPKDTLPIPDFRTVGSARLGDPSPELLDTLYLAQQRQAWYRDWSLSMGEEPLAFIGSVTIDSPVETAARQIGQTLGFDLDAREECRSWEEARRQLIALAEEAGILVMVNGVVGNNPHRPLDPEEFRGFALADDRAPLIFLNGRDAQAAQMFTLAHELAHLWLGQSALTDAGPASHPHRRDPHHRTEVWCNAVAAELLVPLETLRRVAASGEVTGADGELRLRRLTRRFKVSALVILRRLLDAGLISRQVFDTRYHQELSRGRRARASSGGGDFYRTAAVRLGRRFARALIASTLEGQTLYRDAYRMLGVRKHATFRELGQQLGFPT